MSETVKAGTLIRKTYEYMCKTTRSTNFDDPGFLLLLNTLGKFGWKKKDEHSKGAQSIVILFEREVEFEVPATIKEIDEEALPLLEEKAGDA